MFFSISQGEEPLSNNSRKPADEKEYRYWLQNMTWHHQMSLPEMKAALGLSTKSIQKALQQFDIRPETKPKRPPKAPLLVLPYPGGRHPRIGFLEGAIHPQRETKVSIFAPWKDGGYVVADIPEAIWSNLGLTYLAHTHVPTIWTNKALELKQLEWNRMPKGKLHLTRKLPNGIVFSTTVLPDREGVRMKMTLTNGTKENLSDLRVQNCVMLKAAAGFSAQNNENKIFAPPYAACRSESGNRFVITAWTNSHRCWANKRCPCIHADPKFPDCKPGETKTIFGWLSFYEGMEPQKEFLRLDRLNWKRWPE